MDTVDAYLNLSATQTTGHTGGEGTGQFVAKADVLQFDIVAVVNVRHVDAYLAVLLRLHTLRECHRFGFHLTIGVERGDGFYALVGRHDGWEAAVGIILELFDGYAASETTTIRQFARVVEEVGVAFIVGHATVVSERLRVAEGHNLAGIGPGTCGRGSCAVGNVFWNTTGSIEQLIDL